MNSFARFQTDIQERSKIKKTLLNAGFFKSVNSYCFTPCITETEPSTVGKAPM